MRQVYEYSDEFWANLLLRQSDHSTREGPDAEGLWLGPWASGWTPLHSVAALLLFVTFGGDRAKKYVTSEIHHILQPLPENTPFYSVPRTAQGPLQEAFAWFDNWIREYSPAELPLAVKGHSALAAMLGEAFTRSLLPNMRHFAERVGREPEVNSAALTGFEPFSGDPGWHRERLIVGFLFQSSDEPGNLVERGVDASAVERWKEDLRARTRIWDAPVRFLSAEEWRMPKVSGKTDILSQESLPEIKSGMAVALDELGVAPHVVQEFRDGDLSILELRLSRRVILYRIVEAPIHHLGSLW